MAEYKQFADTQLTVKSSTMRKNLEHGEERFEKYILQTDGDEMSKVSMKLREYYSEEGKETVDGVQFDTEEAEAEPVKPEDIPNIVKVIQQQLNDEGEAEITATVTRVIDGDNTNWFISPQNFDTIEVKMGETK